MTALVLGVCLIVALGVALRLRGVLRSSDARVLNVVALNIGLPVLTFRVTSRVPLTPSAFVASVIGAVSVIVALGAAFVVTRIVPMPRESKGALLLVAAFGNTAYLGYPIVEALCGTDALPYAVLFDQVGIVPLLFTAVPIVGELFGARPGERRILLSLVKFPPTWGVVAGFLWSAFQLGPLDPVLERSTATIAGMTVPMVLLALGLNLVVPRTWSRARLHAVAGIVAIKLIFVPLVVLAIAHVMKLSPLVRSTVVLQSAMPTMMGMAVMASQFELDDELITLSISTTTILSGLTIVLMFFIAR